MSHKVVTPWLSIVSRPITVIVRGVSQAARCRRETKAPVRPRRRCARKHRVGASLAPVDAVAIPRPRRPCRRRACETIFVAAPENGLLAPQFTAVSELTLGREGRAVTEQSPLGGNGVRAAGRKRTGRLESMVFSGVNSAFTRELSNRVANPRRSVVLNGALRHQYNQIIRASGSPPRSGP